MTASISHLLRRLIPPLLPPSPSLHCLLVLVSIHLLERAAFSLHVTPLIIFLARHIKHIPLPSWHRWAWCEAVTFNYRWINEAHGGKLAVYSGRLKTLFRLHLFTAKTHSLCCDAKHLYVIYNQTSHAIRNLMRTKASVIEGSKTGHGLE